MRGGYGSRLNMMPCAASCENTGSAVDDGRLARAFLSFVEGGWGLAIGETAILLHRPLPLVGVTMWMERGVPAKWQKSHADG